MASGQGKRLRPFTKSCPKPLRNIGGKPLLENIIDSLVSYGFYKLYISVNYKAERIETYSRDGTKWNVEIQYLREKEEMGTAGSLRLLPEKPTTAFIVLNGDLLGNSSDKDYSEDELITK